MTQANHHRIPPKAERETSKVVAITGQKPSPTPPPKAAFAPKYLRESWYEQFRFHGVSIATIARRNDLPRRDVEVSILREQDERDAARERVLDRQVALRPSWRRAA